jgi:ribosomal protein S3AE
MAEAKSKSSSATKVKKKLWIPIYAPKAFDSAFLGETHVNEKEQVLGKSVTANLMVLTDDPRKQAYNIRFDVTGVKEGKAQTQAIGILMMPSGVKRLIRRNRDKVDDSFPIRIAGGRSVRVKPVLVTKTKASSSSQTKMRLAVRTKLQESWKRMRFEDIVLDVIDGKASRLMRDSCNHIQPVRSCDIRELIIAPADREVTPEMQSRMEQEAAEEEARRAQLANAAAAAGIEDAPVEKPKRRRKAESDDGPEDMGV